MVKKVAEAVKAAMRDAAISESSDVHYVQTKTPLLTIDSVRDAESRGHHVAGEGPLQTATSGRGWSSPRVTAGNGRVPIQIDREPLWGVACRAGQSGSLQEMVALLALVRPRDIYLPTLL